MPLIQNTLTGAAGEHLVAAQLSIRGFNVGLTRGGSRAVDILASNSSGSRSVAIQVKTSCTAREVRKKNSELSHWTFMMSTSDIQQHTTALIYVFVSLQGQSVDVPDYFIIPGEIVSQRLHDKYQLKERKSSIRMLNILDSEKASFHNRWDIIEDSLNTPSRSVKPQSL